MHACRSTLEDPTRLWRRAWIGLTILGSAGMTIAAVVLPPLVAPAVFPASRRAGLALLISHLVIQVIKRLVGRARPSETFNSYAAIKNPDRFSFPSGHATSSLAVALAYGVADPALAGPLVALGILVGWSRVVLGVHYPGDVLAGQVVAATTVVLLG